jgi:hypothetical protein
MAKIKTPPPPVTKTVQRLLAQIHLEAQAATLAALSAKDGIVTLQPMGLDKRSFGDADYICTEDAHGAHVSIWRDREKNTWIGTEHLTDGQGRQWRRSLGTHIIDDFGTLVPVQGGAT